MDKILTVSVGIPAYNEEANIKQLLESLLKQQADNFELKEIIVVSDGSTDLTENKAQEVRSEKIKITRNIKRSGLAESENRILEVFTGDILVLMNADVLPENNIYLHYLVQPFYENRSLGIVSNDGIPLPAQTFFESVINFSVKMRHAMATRWNNGNNIYLCHGRSRAFVRRFAEQFRFGPSVAEDAYSYLKCQELGFKFLYQPMAKIRYRSPQNLQDHIKQSSRFFSGNKMLEQYFPAETVRASFSIPSLIVYPTAMKYFFANPVKFVFYLYVLLLSNIQALRSKGNGNIWAPSATSKSL